MQYVYIVALLAVAQYFVFGVLVGKARGQYGVKAPAVTGNEHFERAFRVQMNTLEQLVVFLPSLLIAAQFWSGPLVSGLGAVYLVGRAIYRQAYVADPRRRSLGFILTVLPSIVLMLMGLAGAVLSR
jgi:uncharacterized MAPEG superfamily protein